MRPSHLSPETTKILYGRLQNLPVKLVPWSAGAPADPSTTDAGEDAGAPGGNHLCYTYLMYLQVHRECTCLRFL